MTTYEKGLKDFSAKPYTSFQGFQLENYKQYLTTTTLSNKTPLFILNLNTMDEIELEVIPETIQESYSPKIVKQSPYASIQPLNFYVGGNAKELSFSITLHEDLNGIDGNIYSLIDKFKALTIPISRLIENDRAVKAPLVYLQLGEQFAGKGHLTTSVTNKLPFRNGRYLVAEIGLTFTYHEEFDNTELTFIGDSTISYESNFDNLVLSRDRLWGYTQESTANLVESIGDYDYWMKQIYSQEKIQKYLRTMSGLSNVDSNTLITDIIGKDMGAFKKARKKLLKSQGITLSGRELDSLVQVDAAIVILMDKLKEIMKPIYSIPSRISALKEMRVTLNQLKVSQREYSAWFKTDEEIGVTSEQKRIIEQLCGMIFNYMNLYDGVMGAND